MAGELTKDIRKVSVTITNENGKRRTLTALYDYTYVGPEKIEKRDSANKGDTFLRRKEDKSADYTVVVKSGTQDEKFLDEIAHNTLSFDMIIVDESAKLYPKQYTAKECYISQAPEDSFREIDNRTYTILASNSKLEQL